MEGLDIQDLIHDEEPIKEPKTKPKTNKAWIFVIISLTLVVIVVAVIYVRRQRYRGFQGLVIIFGSAHWAPLKQY